MSDLVHTDFKDGIFLITLNRPKANALSLESIQGSRTTKSGASGTAQSGRG
jgi:enoyl-CoA hydratase/carnithine racemase